MISRHDAGSWDRLELASTGHGFRVCTPCHTRAGGGTAALSSQISLPCRCLLVRQATGLRV